MLRAFWTWDPVVCGTRDAFGEATAFQNNKWFFDKSVWQRMFRTMNGCGFGSMILANTHPFPFMIDLSSEYPESRILDDADLALYRKMHHWIFETALDYEITPYLLFFPGYYPEQFTNEHKFAADGVSELPEVAVEYTRKCVRTLLETYPELAGLFASVGKSQSKQDMTFIQQTVVDALDAARPDLPLYLRGWNGDPEEFVNGITRRGDKVIRYSVKYTGDHLVDANPDPSFTEWVETAGPENVNAEFQASNFEPWTSFSSETVEGILGNLEDAECDGFSVVPLSLLDWPGTSDKFFKYQFHRDLVWYSAWGGTSITQLQHEGQPKWLVRNTRIIDGFQAAARIAELITLYLAADKSDRWRPQFCSVFDEDTNSFRLFSIDDMLHNGSEWWSEITGDPVVTLSEYVKSGTPDGAYGPEELIEELADLSEQAVTAGEKGMRNNSGEKELPGLTRDVFCLGRLGEFYVERTKAALAHARGQKAEAIEHMNRALGLYREIRGVDSFHRVDFRVLADDKPVEISFMSIIKALEEEIAGYGG